MRTDILERKAEIEQWIQEGQSKAYMARQLNCNPKTINPVLERLGLEYAGNMSGKGLSKKIQELVGGDYLYFYDAAAPLVLLEGIDFSKAYYKSRYDKGDGKDYINCPFEKDEFMQLFFL